MLKSTEFLRGKIRGRVSGGTKSTLLAPVILGLVPGIFWQRVSNLFYKLALLLHKCWLREDSWDKPKNDWCWRRGFGVYCEFFKYPSPDTSVSPSPSRGEGYTGRSMIEMLGVLTIIGVLSVGGIAGYSKAMEKWKINKAVEQYSYIINGLIKPADELKTSGDKSGVMFYEYLTVVEALGLLPPSWSNKHDNIGIHDDLGNYLQFFVRNKNVVIDFYLGGIGFETDSWYKSNSFSPKLCQEIVQNVFYPLHSVVNNVYLVKESYFGDAFCASKKCLSGIKISEINSLCHACENNGQSGCVLVFEM